MGPTLCAQCHCRVDTAECSLLDFGEGPGHATGRQNFHDAAIRHIRAFKSAWPPARPNQFIDDASTCNVHDKIRVIASVSSLDFDPRHIRRHVEHGILCGAAGERRRAQREIQRVGAVDVGACNTFLKAGRGRAHVRIAHTKDVEAILAIAIRIRRRAVFGPSRMRRNAPPMRPAPKPETLPVSDTRVGCGVGVGVGVGLLGAVGDLSPAQAAVTRHSTMSSRRMWCSYRRAERSNLNDFLTYLLFDSQHVENRLLGRNMAMAG